MVIKPEQGASRPRSALWDAEIDGEAVRSWRRTLQSKGSRVPRAVIGVLGLMSLTAFVILADLPHEIRFHRDLIAVNRRAQQLGGGVSRGRRDFQSHVGAWFRGKALDDRAMLEVVSIVRECQSRGLGGPHLSLDLDGTGVTDEGIRLLHGVSGLQSISILDTAVTTDGADRLRRAQPGTAVYARPPEPSPGP